MGVDDLASFMIRRIKDRPGALELPLIPTLGSWLLGRLRWASFGSSSSSQPVSDQNVSYKSEEGDRAHVESDSIVVGSGPAGRDIWWRESWTFGPRLARLLYEKEEKD